MIYRKPIRVIYLSTYIPQKCGIATFTKDVTNAINLLNPHALAEIMAIVKDGENPQFPWEVKYKILNSDPASYLQAADYVNHSCCDLLMIEHEFGIFGGKYGEAIIPFLRAVHKPKVMTCHTIITDPKSPWGRVFRKTVKYIDAITVMTHDSARKLTSLYGINQSLITVIPHGTPDLTYNSTETYKKRRGLSGRIVLGNINLLSENKGLGYVIDALPDLVRLYPHLLYLIIGQTHPNILEKDGEKYRDSLKQKIKTLGLRKNVRFINRYLSLDELISYLRAIDIYITPYLDPQQSSSGALAYAVGAGKACISTRYLYANEVLDNNRGILIPFRDAKAISLAVIKLLKDPKYRKKIENNAYKYGRFSTWSQVALQHLDLFNDIISKHVPSSPSTD